MTKGKEMQSVVTERKRSRLSAIPDLTEEGWWLDLHFATTVDCFNMEAILVPMEAPKRTFKTEVRASTMRNWFYTL